jgi:hypothetical protein
MKHLVVALIALTTPAMAQDKTLLQVGVDLSLDNLDVANGIGATIAVSHHAPLIGSLTAINPMPRSLPNVPPLFEGQLEWDAAFLGVHLMLAKPGLRIVRLHARIVLLRH